MRRFSPPRSMVSLLGLLAGACLLLAFSGLPQQPAGAFSIVAEPPSDPLPAPSLVPGFQAAFADGEAFRATEVFQVLGYDNDQIRQIAQVTPKPASLTVVAVPGNGPGKFDLIRVTCHEVKYYNLTIDHAVFEFPEVELDPEALEQNRLLFRRARSIGIETFVSSKDILKVFDLVTRARQLSHLRLSLNPKETVLTGEMRKGFLVVGFRLSGRPCMVNRSRIDFQCHRLALNGLPLPTGAVRRMFSHINPVFDAEKTWLNLHLEKMVVETGFVRTQGRILPRGIKG